MKSLLSFWILFIFTCGMAAPQPTVAWHTVDFLDAPTENQSDPAYAIYKKGYNCVLDEKWELAQEVMHEVITKYPKSDYADDAAYWSAYALKHIDRKRGIEAYKKFLKQYPSSRYFDDAIADMTEASAPVVVSTSGDSVVVRKLPGGYSYGVGNSGTMMRHDMERMEREMAKANRELKRTGHGLRRLHIAPFTFSVGKSWKSSSELDPKTRVKLDAIYAMGDMKEDEKTFNSLKDIALDQKQPLVLRQAALDVLSDYDKYDVAGIYIDLARKDTNAEIQDAAIQHIGDIKDKTKAVDVLISLYGNVPKSRTEQLHTILFVVADVGNDRAVDFLTDIAISGNNYELRSDAVYYLGNIGGEKARAALTKILKNE